jgi:Fur family transcriptional regulator, iron response regulator
MPDLVALLRQHDIQPTPQRLAVAMCILSAKAHPTAEQVWAHVKRACPTVSRATVYNSLNLFVEKGLVTTQNITDGAVVYEPRTEAHHHFIDERTGKVYDIPWEAIKVAGAQSLAGFEVHEYQVILRGRKR